jgi:DNA polymerase-1
VVTFKAAFSPDRLYRRHDAWLIVPNHDAFVFEAPLDRVEEVARLTERVMCETVREYFPQLRPRAEVNIKHPECWNKDGHHDSVQKCLDDPTYRF